jgi:hypothetical protein
MCYTLPKIWQARIQKYWDKVMPANYPKSDSVFSLTFDNAEDKAAVTEFEETIKSEESVVATSIPEGHFFTEYLGCYDVTTDVDPIPEEGIYTLLSPEKVTTDDTVTALHYENGEWVVVEDAAVVDGYVYGTLKSFSPVAIVFSKKDIHEETMTISGVGNVCVCEGNPVVVKPGTDGYYHIVSQSSGKDIKITKSTLIVGGSIDGTPIKETSVNLVNVRNRYAIPKVIGGSYNITNETLTTVDTVNVYYEDSASTGVTGSFGAVRTNNVNITLNNSKLDWLGAGEGYAKLNTPPVSFASTAWAKNINIVIENTTIELAFIGSNCEYFYANKSNAKITGSTFGYLISGCSNDGMGDSFMEVADSTIGIYQSVNRGNVVSAEARFKNCTVDNLYIGGDASDKTVTGTTEHIKVDIAEGGTYNIVAGTEAGAAITKEFVDKVVESVKVSRAAAITITDDFKAMLGSKLVIK